MTSALLAVSISKHTTCHVASPAVVLYYNLALGSPVLDFLSTFRRASLFLLLQMI